MHTDKGSECGLRLASPLKHSETTQNQYNPLSVIKCSKDELLFYYIGTNDEICLIQQPLKDIAQNVEHLSATLLTSVRIVRLMFLAQVRIRRLSLELQDLLFFGKRF
jgi:hypothetical protein